MSNPTSKSNKPNTFERTFNTTFEHRLQPRRIDILVDHLLAHKVQVQFVQQQCPPQYHALLEEAFFSLLFLKENLRLSD